MFIIFCIKNILINFTFIIHVLLLYIHCSSEISFQEIFCFIFFFQPNVCNALLFVISDYINNLLQMGKCLQ